MSNLDAATPTDERKLRAYARYRAADTVGTLNNVGHPNVLSDDFVQFIERFCERDLLAVDVAHLADVPFVNAMLYRALLSTTFHAHWAQYEPAARGPAAKALVEVQHDGNNKHSVVHHGLTAGTEAFTLDAPSVTLTDRSVTLEQGVVRITFSLTDERVDGARVWRYELDVLERNRLRFYLVPFAFAQE